MKPIEATEQGQFGRGKVSPAEADPVRGFPDLYAPGPKSAIPWPGHPGGAVAGPTSEPAAATGRCPRPAHP